MPASVSLSGIPAAIRGTIFHARFRELLLWCLPALVAGLLARGWILFHYHYAYVHPDSADFLITAQMLLQKHHFVLHGKKAFLAPVLYALPLLVRIPTLLVIPWAQHLFGLIFTLMAGELVRLWTRFWKAWIIPVTLLATLNPAMLWYEHTLISEFQYLWCVTALLLAGTACALWPGKWRFVLLLLALLLTAGSRPEGKLYVCFCLLLVLLIPWGAWKTRLIYGGLAVVFCALTWLSSHNTQAGVLLYATVLPLAPDVPKSAPGFAEKIDPLRQEKLARGPLLPEKLTTAEKDITPLVTDYLTSVGDQKTTYGEFCQRLAIEAALNKPLLLPVIAFNKFLAASIYPPSGDFGEDWMQVRQIESCTYKSWMIKLMPRLAGSRVTAPTREAVTSFVQTEYVPHPEPFATLREGWAALTTGARVGDQHYGDRTVPGVPAFFLLAAAGMIASICRPGPLRRLHLSWIMTLGFVFLVVMLTGVMNSRYRFVFEPFCLLYIFVLLDCLASLLVKPKSAADAQ